MQATYPLEQLAKLTAHPFQHGFARQALELLESSDLVDFEASREGLLMRGQNEAALSRPAALLRDIYGDDLSLSPPRVRYVRSGSRLLEPVMLLRVRILPRHLPSVRADLAAREVTVLEHHQRATVCVLRGEAPLRRLLGYGAALDRLTDASGLHWTWLDRYSPVEDPPGGRAA